MRLAAAGQETWGRRVAQQPHGTLSSRGHSLAPQVGAATLAPEETGSWVWGWSLEEALRRGSGE